MENDNASNDILDVIRCNFFCHVPAVSFFLLNVTLKNGIPGLETSSFSELTGTKSYNFKCFG